MSPVHLRNLGIPWNQPEDREGLFRTTRPGRGHLGHSGGWQDTEGNHTFSAIHLPIPLKSQTRGLEGYGSISLAPPTPQRSIPMEHDKKRFILASHLAELGASLHKIFLKEIPFKDLMVITKGWNPTKKLRLLEEREVGIRENQATIQAIEEQLNQTGPPQIPSFSQVVHQPNSPVSSHNSGTNRSAAKSHHSSQSQLFSRRRQGYKGKNKTSFSQRQRKSDPMIQKLLELEKEVHNSQK
ncbi:hypothetical protein O181_047715 [Austropuccinia psidii MF-1]|uniref:Uncharacterized protein n=1 Tax=Austropuccinia psidii MF-1 TaxID=1389203 RepID=A0A9Q3HNG0_9BASI|nr:hypothetical protein [Austropuccinia psidii MF-1]